MGFSEILGHEYFGGLNERQKEYTSGIHEAGERLIGLIDDILDLSTIEAGYLELKKETVEVKPLLEGLHNIVLDWARKRNLRIYLSCPDNLGSFNVDLQRIKQALLNLIRNAINFTPEGGRIDIEAYKTGDAIKIVIKDTGIGIAKDDLKRIFQPFERIPTGRSNSGNAGAGLGLALVKNIVQLHGGKIDITSEEQKGTAVTVTLPQ